MVGLVEDSQMLAESVRRFRARQVRGHDVRAPIARGELKHWRESSSAALQASHLLFRDNGTFRTRSGEDQCGALHRRPDSDGQQHQAPDREDPEKTVGNDTCTHGRHHPNRDKTRYRLKRGSGSARTRSNAAMKSDWAASLKA